MRKLLKNFSWGSAVLGLALATVAVSRPAFAQDQDQDDPPARVARLGYMEGSVSFQPAGEDDWVGAVPNRPMTTGDKLWADQDSRAEVQLGSAVIRLAPNTGFSSSISTTTPYRFNLLRAPSASPCAGSTTAMISRSIPRTWHLPSDSPATIASMPAKMAAYTIITIREGEGQATGNGQTYTLHGGQAGTFSGTDSLNADVEQIGEPDQFDSWSETRDHRYDYSRSSHYLHPMSSATMISTTTATGATIRITAMSGSPTASMPAGRPIMRVIGIGFLPGDGPGSMTIPGATLPSTTAAGSALAVAGDGWRVQSMLRPVYAPALVVFIGGGPGGFGGNVGWFPLGPREVYVPSYHVSEAYVNRVNISNTTVNVTQVTNVYNTTIVNNTTTITNITYANRNVQGAVMVVPQHAFTSAQPVAKARVQVSAQQIASAPLSGRVAVAPTRESVLGAKGSTAGHVAAPPAAVANRQVIARKTPPPPPVPLPNSSKRWPRIPASPLREARCRRCVLRRQRIPWSK